MEEKNDCAQVVQQNKIVRRNFIPGPFQDTRSITYEYSLSMGNVIQIIRQLLDEGHEVSPVFVAMEHDHSTVGMDETHESFNDIDEMAKYANRLDPGDIEHISFTCWKDDKDESHVIYPKERYHTISRWNEEMLKSIEESKRKSEQAKSELKENAVREIKE